MPAKVVSQEDWLAARKDLLVQEKEHTRAVDALSAKRRELPMVQVDKPYAFEGPSGAATLQDLFDGRKQLIVYHFMLGPDDTEGCSGCSFFTDCIGDLRHLQAHNTSLVLVSRAPLAKIQAFQKRMGWTYPWYSSQGSDFNYDFQASHDTESKPAMFNYREITEKSKGERPGASVFLSDDGKIFHTYSTYARGLDSVLTTHALLDLTPLGRQEDLYPEGFVHHDKYDAIKA